MNLFGFPPAIEHLLLQGIEAEFPHHNNRSHLHGGFPDDAVLQFHWRRLAAQSTSWYTTPQGAVGSRFMEILSAEWQGVLNRSWNSDRPLYFAHIILIKALGVRRARDIRQRITMRMYL